MLASQRIVVPRIGDRASPLVEALRLKGATVHEISLSIVETLPMEPLEAAARALATYQWVFATAPLSLERFVQAARNVNTAYLVSSRKLAIAGAAAIAVAESHGWTATVQVDRAPPEALLDGLATRSDIEGTACLYPSITGSRDTLPDGIRALGAAVDVVPVGRHAPDKEGIRALQQLLGHGEVDLITASTPAVVDALLDAIPAEQTHRARLACIGPVTARAARSGRLTVAVEATTPTMEGLIAAIVASVSRAR